MVGSMSITDKADQMRGTDPGSNHDNYNDIFRTYDNTNKGVKGFLFRDGPRGVNLLPNKAATANGYSTVYPVAAARGAAFDMDLEYKIGSAAGDETLASGHTMLLAPTVNILRHPAWGRAQETYGEDPYLLGRLGTAFVAGVQTYVPACAKHYAANNIENGRASQNAMMDEQTLREMYARHFEMIIQDGGAACVMASYNLVNGIKATQNKHLLTDLLRGDFNFRGFVLSDWWAMPPGNGAATPDALAANARDAVNAGLDMELPWHYNFDQLESLVQTGALQEAQLTQAASRILEVKYRFNVASTAGGALGLKTPTSSYNGDSVGNNDDHIALSHQAAVESMVLLKNDNNTLPIKRSAVKTVAVIGASVAFHVVNTTISDGTVNFATDVRIGDLGSSQVIPDPAKSSGPAAGIQAVAGNGIKVVSGNDPNLADQADFVVVVAGLTPEDEGEEYTGAGDRNNFTLDGKHGGTQQNQLITTVAGKNKPMVVVLEGGSVIDMPWMGQVPAVVMAWYPGMDGGRALGELLFGDANFSGKLPITWPQSWNDEPPFNVGTTNQMDYYLGYRYFDKNNKQPLFPFGFGLSYTTFKYQYLSVPCSDVTHGGVVPITVDITNSGTVKGDEVAFLFVSYPQTQARRPAKELKGFRRVSLDPGVTKRVTFLLRVSDLKYWDSTSSSWIIENGPVQISVGPSSAHLMLSDTMVIK
jgi:beta-glucosidase